MIIDNILIKKAKVLFNQHQLCPVVVKLVALALKGPQSIGAFTLLFSRLFISGITPYVSSPIHHTAAYAPSAESSLVPNASLLTPCVH